jgi:hypothetical protein
MTTKYLELQASKQAATTLTVTIIKSTFNIETKPFPDLIKIG